MLKFKCPDMQQSLILASKISEKLGEEQVAEGEFVGRVCQDGGKSGERKQELPPKVQIRIDQLWQLIDSDTKVGLSKLARDA